MKETNQYLARYWFAVPAGKNGIPVGKFIINQAPWASHYESATYGSALSGPGYVHTPGVARHVLLQSVTEVSLYALARTPSLCRAMFILPA